MTIIKKYLHGWLATKKRHHREGRSPDAQCQLCGEEETRSDFLFCLHSQIKDIRQNYWTVLIKDIGQSTAKGFKEISQVGLAAVTGWDMPTDRTKEDWPREMREAFSIQSEIG